MNTCLHDQRFRKTERLLNAGAFGRVFRGGARGGDGLMVVYALPNGLGHGRLGLVVSRKCGSALRRNRIKRLLREAFRLNKLAFAGLDVVTVARSDAAAATLKDVSASLIALATRAAEKEGHRVKREDAAGGKRE